MPLIDIDFRYPTDFTWAEEIAREEFTDALQRAGLGLKSAIGRQFVLDDAVASGKTAKSFNVSEVEDLGDRMQISVLPIGDRAKVVEFLEFGTNPSGSKPSPEMVERIKQWAIARGIIRRSDDSWRPHSMAYGIARSILANGIEERRIIEHAENHYGRYITQIMNAAARRIENRINQRLAAGIQQTA
jgi:hypothetical protein